MINEADETFITRLYMYVNKLFISLHWSEISVSVREQLRELTKQYEKSENDLKALQSVGQVRSKQNLLQCFIIPT